MVLLERAYQRIDFDLLLIVRTLLSDGLVYQILGDRALLVSAFAYIASVYRKFLATLAHEVVTFLDHAWVAHIYL